MDSSGRKTVKVFNLVDLPKDFLCDLLDFLEPQDIIALIQTGIVDPSLPTQKNLLQANAEGDTLLQIISNQEPEEDWMEDIVTRYLNAVLHNHGDSRKKCALHDVLPIQVATNFGRVDAVRALASAHPAAGESLALVLAAGGGRNRVKRAWKAASDFSNTIPLNAKLEPQEQAYDQIVELLIEAGADVNSTMEYGVAALHVAAVRGRRRVVQLLIDAGADKSAQTTYGPPSVILACRRGHHDICALLEEGEDIPEALCPPSKSEPERMFPSSLYDGCGEAGATATALYDKEADEDNDLSLVVGEKIHSIEFVSDPWWFGSCNGENGFFPANYVRLDWRCRHRGNHPQN